MLEDGIARRRGATVYVVVPAAGNSGPFVVERDGVVWQRGGRYEHDGCLCGNLDLTAGHYTNRREAQRVARCANRAAAGED